MRLPGLKNIISLTGGILFTLVCHAQIGGLGGALLNMDFGQAHTDDLHIPGPAMLLGHSDIPYVPLTCPARNTYGVVSGIDTTCDNNTLIPLYADNTPLPDNNGYMMLLNDIATSSPRTIFEYTVAACNEVNYQFSVSIINLERPTFTGCHRFSSFTLQVEDANGHIIGSTTTGDIQFAIYSQGYHFNQYTVNFRLPAGAPGNITVKLIDEAKALSSCNNFLAIDDIKVVVTGPKVNVKFADLPLGIWVTSACYQQNKVITMNGTIDAGIINPAIQWQMSSDSGRSWHDIPGATGYSYSQLFNVPGEYLFQLRAADSSLISHPGCGIASELLKVIVDGPPGKHKATNNSPLCAGGELKLDAEGGAAYLWTGPNGFSDNVKFPQISSVSQLDSGWYYVDVISLGGCVAKDSTHVIVKGIKADAGPDVAICKGETARLLASEGATYVWTPATGLSATNIRNPRATPASTTTYLVKITSDFGCTDTSSVQVLVKNQEEVKAVIAAGEYVCRPFDSLLFTSKSLGQITNWHWDFGNGQSATSKQPSPQYYSISAGDNGFVARLIVSDASGCADTAFHFIRVADNCNIGIPTAFTPNRDNLNDLFCPLNMFKADNIVFRIYSRSGQLLFEAHDRQHCWDGTVGGEAQPAGVYVWTLTYNDMSGKRTSFNGTVALIR